MQKSEFRLDVTGAAAALGKPLEIAATAFLPPAEKLSDPPVIVFAVPGGGYGRGYFDMRFPGHRGYSEAEHHVGRGLIVVAFDHIGVGDSTIPDLNAITFENLAATYDSAVRQTVEKFARGAIAPGFPGVTDAFKIGIGQSMGGSITILTQGLHAPFDAIAPLAFSAIHTVLPVRDEQERPDPVNFPLEMLRWAFHWEDEPEDIVQADIGGGYPRRKTVPPFGSGTMPTCVYKMVLPGAMAKEAAAIRTPVLIAAGERDVLPTPRLEPSAYSSSSDVSLYIVPNMAHMHNFASTRAWLWDRIADWSLMLARERGG